jgi:hypothetical protein
MPEISKTEWERALQTDEKSLASIREAIKTLKDGGKVENLSLANALSTEKALEAVIKNKKVLISKLADQQGAQGRLSNGAVAMNARQAFEQASVRHAFEQALEGRGKDARVASRQRKMDLSDRDGRADWVVLDSAETIADSLRTHYVTFSRDKGRFEKIFGKAKYDQLLSKLEDAHKAFQESVEDAKKK